MLVALVSPSGTRSIFMRDDLSDSNNCTDIPLPTDVAITSGSASELDVLWEA